MKHKLQTLLKHKLQWLLLLVALLGVSQGVWADYYYRGGKNNWGATKMTQSSDGSYWYYTATSGNHEFKITTGNNWDTQYTAYDNTLGNITLSGGNGNNITCNYSSGTHYVIIYSNNQKICASSSLPTTVTIRVKKEGDYASNTPYLYAWAGTTQVKLAGNWPGSAMTYESSTNTYKYSISKPNANYSIIISQNGSNQTSDITGLSGDKCYSVSGKSATAATASKPTVTSATATSVTSNSATLGGNVTDAGQTSSCGAQTVTARGIEWVSGTGKTAGAKEAASAGGTGSFTVNVTGLTAGTTYTYRAYATNATGTSYGSNKSFTTTTSCTTPTNNDINISVPASATTIYLGEGSAPSVNQTLTATCSKGNTYLWSATPTTYTSSSCWPGTATRVAFTSASSKSTTATFNHEGVYTATFAAGCGNTTDASKNAPIITVKPGHIYFDGPFFSGSGYDLTKYHLEIDKSNDEFVYEWTATSSNTVAKNDFIISVGNQCINATTSAYDIGNYADLTLNGLVIPDKDTSSNTNCNHNFRANIGTIAVGERLKLTISYTGVNSSGVPKYTVKLEKVCSNPTVQTVSGTATICDGSSTNVTVSSSQSNYTYKLYKGGSATSTTQAGTGSALNFSVSEAGAYTVHAYYTSGSDAYCTADMSGTATITVNEASVAGTISGGSSTLCSTAAKTLTLKNYKGSIQWHKSTTKNFTPSESTAISGATSATYSATPTTTTYYYKAVVTNGVCAPATTAQTSLLVRRAYRADDFTLSDNAQTYDGTAKAVTVALKANIDTTSTAGISTSIVTVYYTGTGTTTYAKSTTAPVNAGSYAVTIDVTKGSKPKYYCPATDISLGSDSIKKADQATLTISNTATDLVYCDAANVKLTTSGGSGDGAVTYTVTSGSGSVDVDVLSPSAKGSVSVTATKAASQNFNATTSAAKTFNFNKTAPTVYTLSNVGGATTICGDPSTGAGSGTLRLANSQTGYNYQLYSNGSPVEGYAAKAGTDGSSIDFPVTSSGTYTVYAYYGTNSSNCATQMDGEITLTISTQPKLVRSAASVTEYMPVTITSVSTDIAEWKIVDGSGNDVSSSTAYLFDQTYDAISFKGASTNASTPKTYTIKATTAGGCSETTTVTVNPDTESCGS